jgi:muramoyltetrapeptide carboxypeptidase
MDAAAEQPPAARKPPRLRPGMTLGVAAPSSPVLERSQVTRGVARLESLGFKVVFGRHAQDSYGYLAGHDQDRAADLLDLLERDDVDGVICLRGGYGALRTALALDPRRLARLAGRPARAFIGFSDITALHMVLRRELGWVTFHGPAVVGLAAPSAYTLGAFERALMEAAPFDVLPDPDDPYVETLVPGVAEGVLLGGCLELLVALIGTRWAPKYDGAILFFEDAGCAPYQIDGMLTQLIASGALARCAGIVIGEHYSCGPKDPGNTLGLEQVFDDLIKPLGVPPLYHLPIGHGRHLATLPLGVRARLNATGRQLRLLEGGVA